MADLIARCMDPEPGGRPSAREAAALLSQPDSALAAQGPPRLPTPRRPSADDQVCASLTSHVCALLLCLCLLKTGVKTGVGRLRCFEIATCQSHDGRPTKAGHCAVLVRHSEHGNEWVI